MFVWNRTADDIRSFFRNALKFLVALIFTALHGMQTRSSDENSVCPSVRLSVCHTREL